MPTLLKFSEEWPKLERRELLSHPAGAYHCTTIRLDKQTRYWHKRVGQTINVSVCGTHRGQAVLVAVDRIKLKDISDDLAQSDAGMTAAELKKKVAPWYKKEEEWKGDETVMLILCLRWA